MSRNALILDKILLPSAPPDHLQPARSSGAYLDLIRRLFRTHSVLAVIGAGSGSRSSGTCRGIASDLAASGKRVVIVQVDTLLQADPLPPPTGCLPGTVPNVWLWPSAADSSIEFYHSSRTTPADPDWLASLRRDFDSVLLNCPSPQVAPETAEIAAMADAAVLVVESGLTTRSQIQHDQRALELRGVKLAGCILIKERK